MRSLFVPTVRDLAILASFTMILASNNGHLDRHRTAV